MKKLTNEIINKFKLYLYEEEKSDNTIEKYTRDIGFFVEWLCGRELEKSVVLEYKKELCEKYAPASVNSKTIICKQGKGINKVEYERLLTAAKAKNNERLYYLMQTIAATGLRISKLKYITCEAIKARQAVINCKGKIMQVFLQKKLCKMLKGYIKKNNIKGGTVFITKTGRPLDRSCIWKTMKDLCEKANVSREKVFPHNLRHLCAQVFYSLQKDIVRLADILGHSSIETTRIYTIESGEVHQMQLQKLGLLRC